MRRSFGVAGRALDWILSYLTGRSQFVRFNGTASYITPVVCGVPQGSVLGPVLFLLYASGVIKLVQNCGLYAHAYADELQIYGHVNPAQSLTLMARIADCITRIGAWTASNRLCLGSEDRDYITGRCARCTCAYRTISASQKDGDERSAMFIMPQVDEVTADG